MSSKAELLAKLEGAADTKVPGILRDAPGALKADKEVVLAAVAKEID